MNQDYITVSAIRTNCFSGKELLTEVNIERIYNLKSWWIHIVKGGSTGFESMREDEVRSMVDGWCACSGIKRRWDELFIPGKEMMKIADWVESQKQLRNV